MSQNKVSRRDALKILGAALGGAALSTIPPKWAKPALAASQLPEHARQSIAPIVAGPSQYVNNCHINVTSTAYTVPPKTSILLRYSISIGANTKITSPSALNGPGSITGTVMTDAGGTVSLSIIGTGLYLSFLNVVWTFDNSADGSGSATQTFNTNPSYGC